jgi:hypothetical protein
VDANRQEVLVEEMKTSDCPSSRSGAVSIRCCGGCCHLSDHPGPANGGVTCSCAVAVPTSDRCVRYSKRSQPRDKPRLSSRSSSIEIHTNRDS